LAIVAFHPGKILDRQRAPSSVSRAPAAADLTSVAQPVVGVVAAWASGPGRTGVR
jgi:hypothetical protein